MIVETPSLLRPLVRFPLCPPLNPALLWGTWEMH